ncbi:translocation/assembly module TamB domain-containing protein [Oricola thermophila]|uniref:Translocation/assembly module TamB domain-containing protein n=1 Tax=Oricola thermophila TaxID=2742145 RepID=A0A6N1VCH8_9HYPH|nr:translocation/assembly module TamB domain-containing protein [Oricola thermophila]QKV18761.1 translocation/assembly module TamB domain-containing protein [Oricola thermophila]
MTIARRLLLILLPLALLAWAAAPARPQDSDEAEKSRLILYVEEQLSAPNRQIRLNGIRGTLSSDVRFESITIADEDGVWLTIVNPRLQWTRSALLRGRLNIESLTAERIDWPRMPRPDDSAPAPESAGLQFPELPVSVTIGELTVPEARFGEPVFGLASVLSLAGRLSLEGGSLDTILDIERLDGPGGRLSLEAAYEAGSTQLDIALSLEEPADGVVANLLNIPDRPDVALTVEGSGELERFNAALTFDVGGERTADGELVVTGANGSSERLLRFDLSGPISRILPEEHRAFFGPETALTADVVMHAENGFEIRRLALDSGALDINASGSILAGGFPRELSADITLRSADAAPVRLPLSGDPVTVGNGAITLRYGTDSPNSWKLDGAVSDIAFPGGTIEEVLIAGDGDIAGLDAPADRALTFGIDAEARGFRADDPAVAGAVGNQLDVSAEGNWSTDNPLRIENAAITGDTMRLTARGLIENLVFKGTSQVEAQDLNAFSLIAGRTLAGQAALAANGSIAIAGGAFDLTFDGTLSGARIGQDSADRLLAGDTKLTGGASRSADGLRFSDLNLANDQMNLRVDGTYATRSAALRVYGEIPELAAVIDDAAGRLTFDASLDKPDGSRRATPYDLVSQLTLTDARLSGRAVPSAELSFDGQIEEETLAGTLAGDGLVGGDAIDISAILARSTDTLSLKDLSARVGSATLTGELSIAEGKTNGQFSIAAPDISTVAALALSDASGALNGTATITGPSDSPNVSFDVRGSELTAAALRANAIAPVSVSATGSYQGNTVRLSQFSARNAQNLDFSGSGTIPLSGPGLSLRIAGSAPLGLAERFLAERGTQLTGTIRADATLGGSLASPSADGLFSLSGASATDPQANLKITDITGLAGLRGNTISITRLTGRVGGGSLSVSGTIGLAGTLPADLDIALSNATYSDGETIRTTLSGKLALSGPLTAGPLLSGQIDLLGTEITVPETIGSEVDLLPVRHVAPDSGTLRTLDRIAAVLPKTGDTTVQAPVRLNIVVNSPNRIFVRGRGIDAELGGRVRVSGPLDNPQPVGAFNLIRGRLSILSKRLQLTEGSITLTGSLDPMLNLEAQTSGDGILAYVGLSGRASDLSLDLSSSPELPEDEILARVLFGKSISSLSPLQIANLATAAASLASGGSGAGLSERIRQGIGVDDLDITQDKDGNIGVRAGKYVQDNVYLDVEAGQSGGEASINLDITDSLTARGTVDTEGDSKLGIFFEKDY